ncbi:7471_t:CDS:2 [Racocetra persica]|uniref:7471_t:CDS:1 n=1 Tax=Racocetra persica TaxID=160502 RepID=A0ACA9LF30_9GLOM|nr:7471_t:CDS:2 [Racocetra persica]
MCLAFVVVAIMTDSNISKNDFSDICHSLGMSTEGNKADLVQRLKEFQAYGHYEKSVDEMRPINNKLQEDADVESVISDYHTENIEVQNPETQRLRELLRKANYPSNDMSSSFLSQDTEETSDHPLQTSKHRKNRSCRLRRKTPTQCLRKS